MNHVISRVQSQINHVLFMINYSCYLLLNSDNKYSSKKKIVIINSVSQNFIKITF